MQEKMRRERDSRSASKPTTPLNRLRGTVGEKKNWGALKNAFDSVKNDGFPRDYARLYRLGSMSVISDVALPAAKAVKKQARIQSVTPLDTVDIYREVAWVATVLKSNATLLRKFATLREAYVNAMMRGELQSADQILASIDANCGLSLWVIENRIALKALNGGFEMQKIYISSIVGENRRSFAAFFASSIGERNESRVSKINFEARLREKIKSSKIKENHENFLLYKLIGVGPINSRQACEIFTFEAASSPVDLYETFIDVLAKIHSDNELNHARTLEAIASLQLEDDVRVRNLLTLYSGETPTQVEPGEHIDAFLSGEYDHAIELVQRRVKEVPQDFTSTLVAARLSAMGKEFHMDGGELVNKIVSLFRNYLIQGKENDEAAQALERLALNFRSLPVAWSIEALLNETSADLLGEIPVSSAVRASVLPLPVLIVLLDEPRRLKVLAALNATLPATEYARISLTGSSVDSTNSSLSSEARNFANISYARRSDQFALAFENLDGLSQSSNWYLRQEAAILRAWFFLGDGDITASVLHTVRTAIERPTLLRSLPILKLFEYRGFRDLKQLENELCLSIGFFLYISLARENTKDVALKVAWKQFHKSHGVRVPSELPARINEFNKAELLYFLRNVCTQEIMELSSEFNSPADLDRERLKICISLSELDQENVTEYNSEIIELTRRLSIEDGVQQVESSRVYVDLLGLQRWCHQNLNELFLRYLDYAGAGLDASNEELERSLLALLRKTGFETEVITFIDSYDVSADSLLAELIEAVATAFLTLPRFGLDAFLGSRVRHGSLEGGFRSPLEARRLITKIDSSLNQYESNHYWLDDIQFKSKEQKTAIDKVLNNFSKSIDALIDGAISRFVYVRTAHNSEGLITLWPSDEKQKRRLLKHWLIETKLNLLKDATIEQFVEFCTSTFFWPTLKQSLSGAAQYVSNTLANQFRGELDNLSSSIQGLTKQLPMLIATIDTAKDDIEAAASKVSKWFSPPQFTNAGSSYLLKTGIEIGITSLRHRHPSFQLAEAWEVDERANVLLHPHSFQTINDVAFLIFGNILKHSGHFNNIRSDEVRPNVRIVIKWKEPHFVEVEVINSISATKDQRSILENVEAARQKIALGEFDSVAEKKTKTGLVRLASTLNYERSTDKNIEFGVTGDNKFRVYFSVPVFFLTGRN